MSAHRWAELRPLRACIVATADDKTVLCGRATKTVGITLARHVQAHTEGRGPEWCPECLALWRAP